MRQTIERRSARFKRRSGTAPVRGQVVALLCSVKTSTTGTAFARISPRESTANVALDRWRADTLTDFHSSEPDPMGQTARHARDGGKSCKEWRPAERSTSTRSAPGGRSDRADRAARRGKFRTGREYATRLNP